MFIWSPCNYLMLLFHSIDNCSSCSFCCLLKGMVYSYWCRCMCITPIGPLMLMHNVWYISLMISWHQTANPYVEAKWIALMSVSPFELSTHLESSLARPFTFFNADELYSVSRVLKGWMALWRTRSNESREGDQVDWGTCSPRSLELAPRSIISFGTGLLQLMVMWGSSTTWVLGLEALLREVVL